MERNKLGRIIGCDAGLGNARVALRGLEFPGGLAVSPTDSSGLPKASRIG